MSDYKVQDKGTKLTLLGSTLHTGDAAPEFKLSGFEEDKADFTGIKITRVSSDDFKGKVIIMSILPSLDTPTCKIETKRFNMEAEKMSDDIVVLTVSRDLPFAQARWCKQEDIKKVITLSDFRNPEFGTDYGVLMEGRGLFTRAVFVIDKEGKIAFIEVVPELNDEPDYTAITNKAKDLAAK
ncbi:thiol peroxidase [Parelusimicrobium proximum]|uniref:thiol peroxidase n=1 Tax=Parelusimicrobium proximum TaxID=3228953 RepID=UPI003D173826